MNTEEYIKAANTENMVQIHGKVTNRDFSVREFTYGVLVPDCNHPLSCVSVANSSLSIDLWIGCKWQCAYCQVQGSNQDLADNGAMPRNPQRRNQCTIDEIVDGEDNYIFDDEGTAFSMGGSWEETSTAEEIWIDEATGLPVDPSSGEWTDAETGLPVDSQIVTSGGEDEESLELGRSRSAMVLEPCDRIEPSTWGRRHSSVYRPADE